MRIPKYPKARLRLPLHIRVLFTAVIVFSVFLSGLKLVASTSNRYVCLNFDYSSYAIYGPATKILVDLPNRNIFSPYRLNKSSNSNNRLPSYHMPSSPDGQYGIDTIQNVDKTGVDLYLVDQIGKHSTLVQDKIVSLMALSWSPDSTKLAFSWFSGTIYSVSVVNADGSDNRIVFQSSNSPRLQGWSSDSLYVAMVVPIFQNNFIQFWSVQDQRLLNLPTHSYIYDSSGAIQWSPIGHRLLYQAQDANGQSLISLATPETMSEITMPWAKSRGIVISDISWSRSGRYFALFNYINTPQGTNWQVDIFRGDLANSLEQVREIDMEGDIKDLPLQTADPQWIENGDTLAFLRATSQDADKLLSMSLEIYHLDEQKHDSFPLDGWLEFPVISPNHRFVALKAHQGGKQSLDILDIATQKQVALVVNADDMGNPYWSPDGSKIAVVSAAGKGENRLVQLTWANADGSGQHELTDAFWDVQTLLWLSDKHSMAFVTWRNEGYGVETVDLDTGTHHQLVDGMAQILNMRQESGSDEIAFWWRGKDGSVGTSGFEVDGKQNYQFKGRGPGEIFSAGLFWSPDHHTAALKMRFKGEETLQLASPDGKWSTLLRDGLSGLGDPLWSPDSSMVAYTLSIKQGPVWLDVFTSAGEAVQYFTYPHQWYSNLGWSQCN